MQFAGWKNHVSIYPAPTDVSSIEPENRPLPRRPRAPLKFLLSEPMPLDLIEKVAHLLVAQNTR